MSVSKGENNVLGHFFFNYKHIIIDEIALDGLEGIGLDLLWRRVEHRINSPLTDKMKVRFWKSILNLNEISIYQLPEPLPYVEIRDRFTIVDNETGDLKDPDDYLDGPYEYSPVPNEYGSCKYYQTRKLISSSQLKDVQYEKVLDEYGDTLVLVASIEERWWALAKHLPITFLQQMMPNQYCILELIGKSRENGQMTTGKTNLTNIVKEPKNLFYHRRCLCILDLVKVLCITQSMASRGIQSLLLRLNRFHLPRVLSVPKVGKTHKIIEFLRNCPKYTARADIFLNMGLFTRPQVKRIRKNNNVFDFVDQVDEDEPEKKKLKTSPPSLQKNRKCICIVSKSDESSQSDDEVIEEPVKYQYKIGVSLMRQAYERFLDAGLKGLSQSELGIMLGIEFYTTRMLCRIFKSKKIVREFFEDRGKQRISRYVAIAAGYVDTTYSEEKKKFLDYIAQKPEATSSTAAVIELDKDTPVLTIGTMKELESSHITEVTVSREENIDIKSLIESRKSLTLRQLKFGNGVIKIVKEKLCITGYQTLSNLVAKEINETPMVTKALKSFLQKLVAAGQIKIYKVRWPGPGNECNFLNLICAPHIKATDPIVRSKYKEVHLRAMAKKAPVKKETTATASRPLSMFVNPRYMKIQKLHESIIKLTYFDPPSDPPDLPPGFLSMTDLMPEMTVKFAISNMSNTGMSEISHLRINDSHLGLKLKDAPPEIAHGIMKCKSLRNSMRLNLKALGMYGLIQLIYQPDVQTVDYANSCLASFLFYVNRNATIINTTGNWPREVDVQSLERCYYFETFEDVKNYWRDTYDISIDTNIVIKEKRAKKALTPPVRREEDVNIFDNGDRYGDGKGPCGHDSCFYMDIARLWRTYYVREPKPVLKPKKPLIKIPKLAKSKQQKPAAKKKAPPKVNPVMKIKTVTRGRKRIPEATVTWTKEEDNIIVMCQAAITIASPSSQPGCLRVRNTVAKDILSLNDVKKSQSICHRRSLMLQLNPSLMHEKDRLLNEMRRRRHLIHKYEGLIKKLRLRYSTNMTKFMSEARIPILELVWLIWHVSKSESYNSRLPCVAMDVNEFYVNFSIVPATANKLYNIYKAPELAILRESVFLTIMLTLNNEVKSEMAKKIYAVFKKYPENSLRIVVDQLRRCGAVSAKEKLFNNQMHRLHLEDIVQSAYKVSANYQRRWIGRLNSEYAVSLCKVIEAEMPTSNIKGSAEINCILCELQALGLIEVMTETMPAIIDSSGQPISKEEQLSVVDIEMKHKLKSGTVSWQRKPVDSVSWDSKTVSSLYKNIEYESVLRYLAKNAVLSSETEPKYNMKDEIINHLNKKGESGSSFKELQILEPRLEDVEGNWISSSENTPIANILCPISVGLLVLEITRLDSRCLAQRLSRLETDNIVKRVGLVDNVIVLFKFIKNWALRVDDLYVIVTPWLSLDFEIRYDILLEWAGVIVNKVFEYPGCSITFLSDSFELVTCRAIQDACMFLKHIKCIQLKVVKCKEPDLFSTEDEFPETSEFNPYESTDNIVAFSVKNSISRYVYIRKRMLAKHMQDKIINL